MTTFCPECGAELMDSAVFCHRCGASIARDEPPDGDPPAPEEGAEARTRSTDGPGEEIDPPVSQPPETARRRFESMAASRTEGDDTESDVWSGTYSSRAMIGAWILAAIGSLLVIILLISFSASGTWWLWAVVALVVLWAALYIRLVYRQWSVSYYLTTQRFIHEQGILRRKTDRIEVIDMDDISFEQGPVERILNVGKITITSSDRTHPEIQLLGIENVKDVAKQFDDARRTERRRRGLHIESI